MFTNGYLNGITSKKPRVVFDGYQAGFMMHKASE